MSELPNEVRSKLLKAIAQHFSEDDLKTICFHLNIEYENLPSEGKSGSVRELLTYALRTGSLALLVKECREIRPNVDWVAIMEATLQTPFQGKEYDGTREAFLDAEKLIVQYIEWAISNNVPVPQVEMKIIAVAMTFSWPFFIETIPRILERYETASVNLEALFVDHKFLSELPLANYDVEWGEVSEFRTAQMRRFAQGAAVRFGSRLTMTARNYRNLPHWHGVLINDENLFLGRTNWKFPSGKPELTVGQNTYRYYDRSEKQGEDRVEMFLNWHRFYSTFNSTLIASIPVVDEFAVEEVEEVRVSGK